MASRFLEELTIKADEARELDSGESVYIEAPADGLTNVQNEIRGALYRAGVDRDRIGIIYDIRVDDVQSVGNKTVWRITRTGAP